MGPVLLLDQDNARALRICRALGAAFPDLPVLRQRNAMELRCAVATQQPVLAILGQAPPQRAARTLAWELKALRPSTPLVALARDDSDASGWKTLGSSVIVVVEGEALERSLLHVIRRLEHGPGEPASEQRRPDAQQVQLDSHRVKNRVAGLLAGMHAFAAELRATAHDAAQVQSVANEYVERLVDVVADISAMVAASEPSAMVEHE